MAKIKNWQGSGRTALCWVIYDDNGNEHYYFKEWWD